MSEPRRHSSIVLLVEDNIAVAIALQDDLHDAGYLVAGPYATSKATLSWLSTHTPDLAVLDITLGDGSCRSIAAELNRRYVPFIVFSGHARGLKNVAEFKNCVWVEKPAPHCALVKALAELEARPERLHG